MKGGRLCFEKTGDFTMEKVKSEEEAGAFN